MQIEQGVSVEAVQTALFTHGMNMTNTRHWNKHSQTNVDYKGTNSIKVANNFLPTENKRMSLSMQRQSSVQTRFNNTADISMSLRSGNNNYRAMSNNRLASRHLSNQISSGQSKPLGATSSSISINNLQNKTRFNRSRKVVMKATMVPQLSDVRSDLHFEEEYFNENIVIHPRHLQQEPVLENYWDKKFSKKDPIKLPVWSEDEAGNTFLQNYETRKIGWIGLGDTGSQLVSNLIKNGYDVTVYDKNEFKVRELVEQGAKEGKSDMMVAQGSDYLFISVGNQRNLVKLLDHEYYGIMDQIREGTIVVNHTPTKPDFQREEKRFFEMRHSTLINAPIDPDEYDGQYHQIKVGGVQSEYEHIKTLMNQYSENLTYVGDQHVE